jgi:hypothetical protein
MSDEKLKACLTVAVEGETNDELWSNLNWLLCNAIQSKNSSGGSWPLMVSETARGKIEVRNTEASADVERIAKQYAKQARDVIAGFGFTICDPNLTQGGTVIEKAIREALASIVAEREALSGQVSTLSEASRRMTEEARRYENERDQLRAEVKELREDKEHLHKAIRVAIDGMGDIARTVANFAKPAAITAAMQGEKKEKS